MIFCLRLQIKILILVYYCIGYQLSVGKLAVFNRFLEIFAQNSSKIVEKKKHCQNLYPAILRRKKKEKKMPEWTVHCSLNSSEKSDTFHKKLIDLCSLLYPWLEASCGRCIASVFFVFLCTVQCNQIGTVRKRTLFVSLQLMNSMFRVLNK